MNDSAIIEALINDRKKDRRAGYIKTGLVAASILIYAGVMAWVYGVFSDDKTSKPFVAVVPVTGTIAPGQAASYEALAPILKAAFENSDATGVVLSINSPGGTPVQSSLVYDLIQDLKKKHNKPVLAVGEDSMTSGAYFIASAADNIVANRSTLTGSIGVVRAGFGFQDLMNKLGVERRIDTAGDFKSIADPFLSEKEKDKQLLSELLSDIHEHFKDSVKTGRGDRLKMDTEGLFEGKVWTGSKAVDIGIIDEIGSLHESIPKYFNTDNYVFVTPKKPLLNKLIDLFGNKISTMITESSNLVPTLVMKKFL